MDKIRLGRTELMVSKTSFGALPIQRLSTEDSTRLIRCAVESGINYFDTANGYTDSEEKLGIALEGIRGDVIISTKSGATDREGATKHIELSLQRMKTDYTDLFQFHNPPTMPDIEDENGAFAAALEAKKKGYIRHIGITNHRLPLAKMIVESGNFETLQFPFCYLASDEEIELVRECERRDVGFIAMKGLSGGLLTNAKACYAFMQDYKNVVPIWGIQRMSELQEWIELTKSDVRIDDTLQAVIEADREELCGNFCRGCGYCLPCAANIEIPMAARMSFLLRRAPLKNLMSEEQAQKMSRIEDCTGCNACLSRCPYNLDTPALLRSMYEDYKTFRKSYSPLA